MTEERECACGEIIQQADQTQCDDCLGLDTPCSVCGELHCTNDDH